MSQIIVVGFASEEDGLAALRSLRSLEQHGGLQLEDTAVVTKDADGSIHVKNEVASGTETGAVVGAMLGGLLTVVFPVAAIIGGGAIGGLIGRAWRPGIDGGS